jgi:hypothetical protein
MMASQRYVRCGHVMRDSCCVQEHHKRVCSAAVPARRGSANQPDALCGAPLLLWVDVRAVHAEME